MRYFETERKRLDCQSLPTCESFDEQIHRRILQDVERVQLEGKKGSLVVYLSTCLEKFDFGFTHASQAANRQLYWNDVEVLCEDEVINSIAYLGRKEKKG